MSSLDVRAIDIGSLREQPCPSAMQQFRIFISEGAFDHAVARGDRDTTREVGGVLVGELLRDDAGPYLRIDATIDALHAEEKGAELTLTHATWEHINREMDSRYQDKRVVGWYHTHPGFGIFLSDRDQFIHRSFFNLPFQVALVYDPKTHEHGIFTWYDNELWRTRRYWIGDREHTWDGSRAAADKPLRERPEVEARRAAHSTQVEPQDRCTEDQPRDALPGPASTFLMIGVMLALLAGVAGHWLGTRTAEKALDDARLAVTNARAEGASTAVAMLQTDLIGLLRNTFSDDAMHQPLTDAVGTIDQIITVIHKNSGAGQGAGSAAGSGSDPVGSTLLDQNSARFTEQLTAARRQLADLELARSTAKMELVELEKTVRRGNALPKEFVEDIARQRAGLGALYSELATDAVRAKDLDRARRLLVAAAVLDPGGRFRYEQQLQSFDPHGRLSATDADAPAMGAASRPSDLPAAAKDHGAAP